MPRPEPWLSDRIKVGDKIAVCDDGICDRDQKNIGQLEEGVDASYRQSKLTFMLESLCTSCSIQSSNLHRTSAENANDCAVCSDAIKADDCNADTPMHGKTLV